MHFFTVPKGTARTLARKIIAVPKGTPRRERLKRLFLEGWLLSNQSGLFENF